MSWLDPCSNCGQHRANCDCGNWGSEKECKICKTKENVKSWKEFYYGYRNGIYVGVYSELRYYCSMHKPVQTPFNK